MVKIMRGSVPTVAAFRRHGDVAVYLPEQSITPDVADALGDVLSAMQEASATVGGRPTRWVVPSFAAAFVGVGSLIATLVTAVS